MWKNHYANLFNCVDTVSDKESVLDTISRLANVHDTLCSDDVKSSVKEHMLVLVYICCLVFVSMLLLCTDFCLVI